MFYYIPFFSPSAFNCRDLSYGESGARAKSAYEAYVERVKAELNGPKYDWFSQLLSEAANTRISLEDCGLYVLDFDGDAAPREVLNPSPSLEVDDTVLDALTSKVSPDSTRFVLLCYSWTEPLNREHFGTLGHALELDPHFFITHSQSSNTNSFHFDWRSPSLLLLDTSIIHFRPELSTITACIMQNTGKSNVASWKLSLLCKLKALSCNLS